jgi:hypothetical protein
MLVIIGIAGVLFGLIKMISGDSVDSKDEGCIILIICGILTFFGLLI